MISGVLRSVPRECFSLEVVLGRLDDPLRPAPTCQPRDISEDGSGSGFACLCTSNLCNNLNTTRQAGPLQVRDEHGLLVQKEYIMP